jgi:hypothetical protein
LLFHKKTPIWELFFFSESRFLISMYIQHSSITWYLLSCYLKKSTQVISIIWERFRLKHKFSWYKSSEYFVYNRVALVEHVAAIAQKIKKYVIWIFNFFAYCVGYKFDVLLNHKQEYFLIVYGVIVISLMSAKLFIV